MIFIMSQASLRHVSPDENHKLSYKSLFFNSIYNKNHIKIIQKLKNLFMIFIMSHPSLRQVQNLIYGFYHVSPLTETGETPRR